MKSLLLSASALLLTMTTSFAEPLEGDKHVKPSVTFSEALKIASETAKGDVTLLELEDEDNKPVFTAELETETSQTHVRIDGMTGEVLATNVVSGATPEAFHMMLDEVEGQGEHHGEEEAEDHGHSEEHGEEQDHASMHDDNSSSEEDKHS